MKTLVVLSGAGISAESGLKTFRDSGGLWENYDVHQVATPEAWAADPALVQRFYNERRKQAMQAEPNDGHRIISELERHFSVEVVTQNVDDLHERAGSTKVLHLHGELRKVRSSVDSELVYEVDGWEVKMGDLCEKGSQLRPHIVWFGEAVPALSEAASIVSRADVLIIVGTSLNVYPAASLWEYAPADCPIYVIDPSDVAINHPRFQFIKEKGSVGLKQLKEMLLG